MTAAVVAPLPIQSGAEIRLAVASDPTAEARKRRREILTTQRHLDATVPDVPMSIESPTTKKRKVDPSATTKTSKKPQMKYDPDVPMTKEEAAIWRREQRRKRNRESAAASRQRQRDRIVELEGELDEWKNKYEEVMSNVRQLEELTGCDSEGMELPMSLFSRDSSSTPPPEETNTVTPRSSPSVSKSLVRSTGKVMDQAGVVVKEEHGEEDMMLPSKMISRPA